MVTVSRPEWPALAHEERPWTNSRPDLLSRSQLAIFSGPYLASVVPPIAQAVPQLAAETESLAAEASQEIVRFDTEVGHIAAPFASILLRSESASSSQIENLTSGAKAIALAELGEPSSRNAALVVGNVRAMQAALELSDRIDARAIIDMHTALLQESEPGITGGWRQEQVWIGPDSIGPQRATFVPPHHSRVPAAIEDLISFTRRVDIPALIQTALAHAQFETIHPFPDGNGRTGRALVQAMLRHAGLTRNITVPVSAGLRAQTPAYFDALTAYRAGDIDPIVRSFAEASFQAVNNGRELVAELGRLKVDWAQQITARRGSGAWKLFDHIFAQPVINADAAARAMGVKPPNAYRAIEQLEHAGVIKATTSAKRNRIWISQPILAALDAFAARAGHRTGGM